MWARPTAVEWTPALSSALAGQAVEPVALEVDGVVGGHLVPRVAGRVVAVAGSGVDEHDAADPVGVGQGELQREVAAEGVPEDDGPLGAGLVEQAEHERRGTRRTEYCSASSGASLRPCPGMSHTIAV